jgi:5'-3' exonuclease
MKVLLVDGQPILYRAASAYPHLKSSQGHATGVIAGAIALLAQMVEKIKPTHLIVFWDEKGRPHWRKRVFEGYKASRVGRENTLPISLESMHEQAADVQKLLRMVGVLQVSAPGVEADDLIALATSFYRRPDAFSNQEVVIASGDRDFCQLLGPFVTMYDPISKRELTMHFVQAEIGAGVHRWADHAALSGAAGDDIFHPPGIGAAKATALIQQYPSLEVLFDDPMLGSARERWKRDLVRYRDQTIFARTLIALPTLANPGPGLPMDREAIQAAAVTWEQAPLSDPMALPYALGFHDLQKAGGQLRSLPTYRSTPALEPFVRAMMTI